MSCFIYSERISYMGTKSWWLNNGYLKWPWKFYRNPPPSGKLTHYCPSTINGQETCWLHCQGRVDSPWNSLYPPCGTLYAGPCGHVHGGFRRLAFSTMSKSCGGRKWHRVSLLEGFELSVSSCSKNGQAWMSLSSWTLIEMRNLKAFPCDRIKNLWESMGTGNKGWLHDLRRSSYLALLGLP